MARRKDISTPARTDITQSSTTAVEERVVALAEQLGRVVGTVQNKSKKPITVLPIFAVATSGGKVVAAGRAIVQKIAASKKANYRILLAGDPAGAELSTYAAPTPN